MAGRADRILLAINIGEDSKPTIAVINGGTTDIKKKSRSMRIDFPEPSFVGNLRKQS